MDGVSELLRVEQVNKHYDGIYALKDADFAIAPGEFVSAPRRFKKSC